MTCLRVMQEVTMSEFDTEKEDAQGSTRMRVLQEVYTVAVDVRDCGCIGFDPLEGTARPERETGNTSAQL